ncbi:MAG: hypothetical protein DRJ49_04380 [Thermoprotei archaeon]|nr:MAG: hypothetical protein DRN53_04040 [Thermoprotei archaeon]RLE88858.1 MAG: hypothetical protein DRJ49_04380 [Thermoprotei archaeon]
MESRSIVEDVLSRTSLRVIKALALNPMATKYALSKMTGLKYRDIERVLAKLSKYNIIIEVEGVYNRYKLNYENTLVIRLLEFLRSIGYVQ